jgi:hypothetical protein
MKVLKLQTFFQSFTIEPVIFVFTIAWSLIVGAEITKKLIMFQICSVGLNLTKEDCENVTAMSTRAEKITVQEDLNILLMRSQFISSVPAIIYSLFAGGDLLLLGKIHKLRHSQCYLNFRFSGTLASVHFKRGT